MPIQPKPVLRPHPRIWFGGNAAAALARAVRLGDSFLGAGSSTAGAEMILLNQLGDTVAEDREQMERLADEVLPELQ